MDLKYKVRTYNFWISLAAAILIVLRLLGQYFGFVVDSNLFMDIATAVCGVLVILGIIIMPTTAQKTTKKDKNNTKDDKTCQNEENTEPVAEEQLTDKTCQNLQCNEQKESQSASELQEADVRVSKMDTKESISDITIEDTEIAIKQAIEELEKNPNELAELVKQILKDKE